MKTSLSPILIACLIAFPMIIGAVFIYYSCRHSHSDSEIEISAGDKKTLKKSDEYSSIFDEQ